MLKYTILIGLLIVGVFGKAQNYPSKGNYDESKIEPYVLPEPLVMQNGKEVKTPRQWRSKRRKEILELFQNVKISFLRC